MASFSDLGVDERVQRQLRYLKLDKPWPVQEKVIPLMLKGSDMLVQAETGSGKTLAYVIPIINALLTRNIKVHRSDGTLVLIIAPTRELCIQISSVLSSVLQPFFWIVSGGIMGGEKKKSEKARLRKGVNILTATPGRLLDHLQNTQCFRVDQLRYLVLDEADRILDLGFERDLKEILSILQSKIVKGTTARQNALISATLRPDVLSLANLSLHNAQAVNMSSGGVSGVSSQGESSKMKEIYTAPSTLKQFYIETEAKSRLTHLISIVKWAVESSPDCRMLLFVSSQDEVEFLHSVFTLLSSISASGGKGSNPLLSATLSKLHGGMSQPERTANFKAFTKVDSGVLISTDVAARGLDFPAVTWLIQYDCAMGVPEYLHRVGRTARGGRVGQSLLFVMPSEVGILDVLMDNGLILSKFTSRRYLSCIKDYWVNCTGQQSSPEYVLVLLHTMLEKHMVSDTALQKKAIMGYQSFIKAYSTYPSELKTIFQPKLLHLGHIARSFGLKEEPSRLAKAVIRIDMKGKGKWMKDEKEKEKEGKRGQKRRRYIDFTKTGKSEFSGSIGGVRPKGRRRMK